MPVGREAGGQAVLRPLGGNAIFNEFALQLQRSPLPCEEGLPTQPTPAVKPSRKVKYFILFLNTVQWLPRCPRARQRCWGLPRWVAAGRAAERSGTPGAAPHQTSPASLVSAPPQQCRSSRRAETLPTTQRPARKVPQRCPCEHTCTGVPGEETLPKALPCPASGAQNSAIKCTSPSNKPALRFPLFGRLLHPVLYTGGSAERVLGSSTRGPVETARALVRRAACPQCLSGCTKQQNKDLKRIQKRLVCWQSCPSAAGRRVPGTPAPSQRSACAPEELSGTRRPELRSPQPPSARLAAKRRLNPITQAESRNSASGAVQNCTRDL